MMINLMIIQKWLTFYWATLYILWKERCTIITQ